MKLVLVEWTDACSTDAWMPEREARDTSPATIISAGHLLEDGPEKLVLALNWDRDNGSYSQVLAVPRAWIRKVVEVKASRRGSK